MIMVDFFKKGLVSQILHFWPLPLKPGYTNLDNIINFNLMMVRINMINNVKSQSFVLGGCVKLKHDSNNIQTGSEMV